MNWRPAWSAWDPVSQGKKKKSLETAVQTAWIGPRTHQVTVQFPCANCHLVVVELQCSTLPVTSEFSSFFPLSLPSLLFSLPFPLLLRSGGVAHGHGHLRQALYYWPAYLGHWFFRRTGFCYILHNDLILGSSCLIHSSAVITGMCYIAQP